MLKTSHVRPFPIFHGIFLYGFLGNYKTTFPKAFLKVSGGSHGTHFPLHLIDWNFLRLCSLYLSMNPNKLYSMG